MGRQIGLKGRKLRVMSPTLKSEGHKAWRPANISAQVVYTQRLLEEAGIKIGPGVDLKMK
jgi:hypothetical protein